MYQFKQEQQQDEYTCRSYEDEAVELNLKNEGLPSLFVDPEVIEWMKKDQSQIGYALIRKKTQGAVKMFKIDSPSTRKSNIRDLIQVVLNCDSRNITDQVKTVKSMGSNSLDRSTSHKDLEWEYVSDCDKMYWRAFKLQLSLMPGCNNRLCATITWRERSFEILKVNEQDTMNITHVPYLSRLATRDYFQSGFIISSGLLGSKLDLNNSSSDRNVLHKVLALQTRQNNKPQQSKLTCVKETKGIAGSEIAGMWLQSSPELADSVLWSIFCNHIEECEFAGGSANSRDSSTENIYPRSGVNSKQSFLFVWYHSADEALVFEVRIKNSNQSTQSISSTQQLFQYAQTQVELLPSLDTKQLMISFQQSSIHRRIRDSSKDQFPLSSSQLSRQRVKSLGNQDECYPNNKILKTEHTFQQQNNRVSNQDEIKNLTFCPYPQKSTKITTTPPIPMPAPKSAAATTTTSASQYPQKKDLQNESRIIHNHLDFAKSVGVSRNDRTSNLREQNENQKENQKAMLSCSYSLSQERDTSKLNSQQHHQLRKQTTSNVVDSKALQKDAQRQHMILIDQSSQIDHLEEQIKQLRKALQDNPTKKSSSPQAATLASKASVKTEYSTNKKSSKSKLAVTPTSATQFSNLSTTYYVHETAKMTTNFFPDSARSPPQNHSSRFSSATTAPSKQKLQTSTGRHEDSKNKIKTDTQVSSHEKFYHSQSSHERKPPINSLEKNNSSSQRSSNFSSKRKKNASVDFQQNQPWQQEQKQDHSHCQKLQGNGISSNNNSYQHKVSSGKGLKRRSFFMEDPDELPRIRFDFSNVRDTEQNEENDNNVGDIENFSDFKQDKNHPSPRFINLGNSTFSALDL